MARVQLGARQREQRRKRVESNMALVTYLAKLVRDRFSAGSDFQDMVQDGNLGLVDAAARYDEIPRNGHACGVRFSAYARTRILGAIYDGIRSRDVRTRASRLFRQREERARRDLAQRLGREPDSDEVADAMGVELDAYLAGREVSDVTFVSTHGSEGFRVNGKVVQIPAPGDMAGDAHRRLEAGRLLRMLQRLPEREAHVLYQREVEGRPLREIAREDLGLSESRVYQLHERAVAKVRSMVEGEEDACP